MIRRAGWIAVVGALLLSAPCAVPGQAKEPRSATDSLADIIAVGRAPGKIILATPALPLAAHRWRFRTILLEPETEKPQAVVLSRSGTKALVVFADGSSGVFDLTQKIASIRAGQVPHGQHRLPGQLFVVARGGQVCLLNDSGQQEGAPCRAAARAAVHEDGSVLYAARDGSLFVVPARSSNVGSEADPVLPYQLEAGAHYELLAGRHGDRRAFLILTQQGDEVRIIDPTRSAPNDGVLGRYTSWETAALRALLEFNRPAPGASSGSAPMMLGDDAIRSLAATLLEQTRPEKYEWSFFRVAPEVALYAPVLEFAANEPAYPSDLAVWERLNSIAKGTTREAYQAAYDTLGAERFQRCKVYYRVSSYPGSWLLEYWYYFPFDEGKPHPHIHDSEHVFVEVDKLGGAVRSVLANAHDSLAPNNLYSTFLRGAQPVTLPLFAFVEFEKHAMSPDMDRDGKFTRGVDVNLYPDRYETWGVRDLGNKKGKIMEPYRPYMTLPRRADDRFALTNSARFFPGLQVSQEKQACGLLPFPEDPPCKTCAAATPEGARTHLMAHIDARQPKNIYKPWVLPWHEVRVGLGLFDRAANNTQFYVAYVSNPRHWTRGHFPFPGRLALEAMFAPTSQSFTSTSGSQRITTHLSHTTDVGARYERFLTNTQGFYGGFSSIFRRTSTQIAGGPVVAAPHWQYEGLWYRLGYILELPSLHKGNLTQHWGVVFHGKTFRFEWRVSLGLLRHHGRNHFGIRPNEPNPYQ